MNTLETLVLQQIGENTTSPDVFTDDSTGMAQIRTSISHAIEDICILTGSVQRTYHIALESGMNFYEVDNGRDYFAWFVSVWLVNQKRRLIQKNLAWFVHNNPLWLKTTATPTHYAPLGERRFCLYPTPSSDTDILKIEAAVIPEAYTLDTDRIKLRRSFKWAAVHYAVSEYWASRGDALEAAEQFAKFLDLMGLQHLHPDTAERQHELRTRK